MAALPRQHLEVARRPAVKIPFEDYWPRFEEVAAHLLVYEENPERDRDAELMSVRFVD